MKTLNRLSVVHTYPLDEDTQLIRELEVFIDFFVDGKLTAFEFIKKNSAVLDALESKYKISIEVIYEEDGTTLLHTHCSNETSLAMEEISCGITNTLLTMVGDHKYQLFAKGTTEQYICMVDQDKILEPQDLRKLN